MNTLSKKEKVIFITYTVAMLLLYISFIIIDFINRRALLPCTMIKYTSIIISGLYTVYLFIDSLIHKKDIYIRLFGLIAIIFTLISDLFLLVINYFYIAGVITFSIAQISTGTRIHLTNKNKPLLLFSISIRLLALIAASIIPFILKDYEDITLYSIVGFYFINLVINFVISLISTIQVRRLYLLLLTIGLLLFIGCDIFVGLANINREYMYNVVAWIFYLPCQYLIAISLKRKCE